MMPDLTANALIELVHRYHPAGIDNEDPRYKSSEEAQRLSSLIQANAAPAQAWKEFVQRLHEEFPSCMIWDTTIPWHDPCRSCRVSLPGFETGQQRYDAVVCLLSLLVPVYALYASHSEEQGSKRGHWTAYPPLPSEFQSHEVKLSALIETTFGFTRLSNDILFIPVPDLVPRTANFGLGQAQLIDCLFTWHRW